MQFQASLLWVHFWSRGSSEAPLNQYIGLAAIIFATINVVGGFLVTDRMLQMFRKKKD